MLLCKPRRRAVLLLLALLAAFLLSLCFRTAMPGFIPRETLSNYWTALRLGIAQLLNQPLVLDRYRIIEGQAYYYETFARLKNSAVTCVAGMAVCLAGAACQTVFKNPLASPNILGVSSGVNLGNAIFLMVYTTRSLSMLSLRFVYCYACAAGLVAVIMGCGKLAGMRVRRFSVMDMLLVGAILSQMCNVVIMYLQYKLEEVDTTLLTTYQELSLGLYLPTDRAALIFFAVSIAAAFLPVLLLRCRFNLTALEDDEARSMGARPQALRFVGLCCGGVLAMTAMIFCGDMGILAMALPCVCRYRSGADFAGVCFTSMCAGGILLLLCRSVCSMIYIGGAALPINFIISLAVLPMFVAALSRGRSAFV